MSTFNFKQFEVNQTGCAMKINTDGVLIAAMAKHAHPQNILDIGTGTGVIALMLAQRYPNATVTAVEIDASAAERAKSNFALSPFANRLNLIHADFKEFFSNNRFDLIVANPPFFINDFKNEDKRKGIARHTDDFFFTNLLNQCAKLFAPGGRLYLILPPILAEKIALQAKAYHLFLNQKINICSDETKAPFRQIICLSQQDVQMAESNFYVYQSPKNHTQAYKNLLKDFFLAY